MRVGMLVLALAACGRIGFDARVGDGGGGDDASDAPTTSGASRIFAYANQTCALVRGEVYCWGDNSAGQLALGAGMVVAPMSVIAATDVAMGETHTCFVQGNQIDCLGNTTMPSAFFTAPIRAVGAGRDFACAIADQMYCWGLNDVGQLGVGDIGVHATPTPVQISSSANVISVGDDHACSVVGTQALCWGHNDNGTLGTGSTLPDHQTTPVTVIDTIVTLPHIAGWHACTRTTDGAVACWGRGDHGELGNGGTADSATPLAVPGLTGVTAIATGGGPSDFDASCAIVPPDVVCWGTGMYGRLGQGTAANASAPAKVNGLPGGAVELALGYDHTCARLANGDVWCWGRGDLGQLGDANGTNSLVPVKAHLPP